jgi:rhamnose utilization protein RhaD (predicted bifunctional aldolase and dehydrogenase)
MSLDKLVELSRRYGTTPGYVLGGGGNTSYKNAAALWVKASGQSLAAITAEGFVALDRNKIRRVLVGTYPASAKEREAEVLARLMDCRLFALGRPSVETFLHELMDFPYVVHTHPAAVNALTCAANGRAALAERFPEAVWVGYVDPGYLLAVEVARLIAEYKKRRGSVPRTLFLENHGLVVAGSSPEEVEEQHRALFAALPPSASSSSVLNGVQTRSVEDILNVTFPDSRPLSFAWAGLAGHELVTSAFTPDHIVYMGVRPLLPRSTAELAAEIARYRDEFGRDPRVAVVPDVGAVAFAPTPTAAQLALSLFQDAAAIARGAQAFGGPRFLSPSSIAFILNWEAESFRSRTSGAG